MKLWLRDADRKPEPQAARADGLKAVLAGTVAWLLGALVAALSWPVLAASGTEWMLWCALTGMLIGVVGWLAVSQRRRRRR